MTSASAALPRPKNKWATPAQVCAIIAFLLDPTLILSILAIVFGALGLAKAKELGGLGRSKSFSALILGVIKIVIAIVVAALLIASVLNNPCGAATECLIGSPA
jgi:small-conductance mechanosensitive channel